MSDKIIVITYSFALSLASWMSFHDCCNLKQQQFLASAFRIYGLFKSPIDKKVLKAQFLLFLSTCKP